MLPTCAPLVSLLDVLYVSKLLVHMRGDRHTSHKNISTICKSQMGKESENTALITIKSDKSKG